MLLGDVWRLLENEIIARPAAARQFNPYRDRHEAFDLPDAPAIRQQNLKRYVACYEERPPLFLLAEAPGPWGCRFSGVPLVSEAQLADAAFPLQGRPSSTRERPHKEYSASIYWRVLRPYFPQFFTWNSVPFHPHDADEPLSIRNPTRREVAAFEDVLAGLLRLMQPTRVVAIGRKAERALREIGAACTYVRHPSQGGAKKFERGVREIMHEMDLSEVPP